MSKVRVKKSQLDYFRRLARSTDLEVQGCLVGRVVSPQLTIIDKIVYPKKGYKIQTPENVQWFPEEYDKVRKKAEEDGLQIVGDIHSHPNYWPVLSETDHTNHITEGFRLTGICATMNKKTVIYFWIAESSKPCTIEYA